jgi:hypothetical protein
MRIACWPTERGGKFVWIQGGMRGKKGKLLSIYAITPFANHIIIIIIISDWLRAGRPRDRSSSHGRVKNFLFSTSSRPALGSTQPPNQRVPGALSLGVKRQGREADHSPTASAEAKKMCIYLYIHSPILLHGECLINNFTFFTIIIILLLLLLLLLLFGDRGTRLSQKSRNTCIRCSQFVSS